MATEDDIVLKLIIQGMDPSEVQRLVQQTQGEINSQMGKKIDELTALHKKAQEAQTGEVKKRVDAELKEGQKELAQIQQIQKAQQSYFDEQERAADKAAKNISNLSLAFLGLKSAFDLVTSAFGKFKELGDQIIENTQIYNGLHGSIDAMREATGGEVADIDLISAKNRGFQKELKLTDEEYGIAAKAAQKYADVTGGDTKDAIDKVIDGLATGRVKMLQSIGVMVDATEAANSYAAAHGLIVENLTEEQKVIAVQEEAMIKLKDKTRQFGDEALTVASSIAQAFAAVKNAIVGAAVAIGNIKLPGIKGYSDIELERIRRADEMVQARTGRDPGNYQRLLAETRKAQAEQAQADAVNYGSDYGEDSGEGTSVQLYASRKKKEKAKRGPGYEPFGPGGMDFDIGKHAAKDQTDYGPLTVVQGEERDPKEEARIYAEFKERKEKLKEVIREAGGPLMSQLMFGPDGPKQTLEEMDAFGQASIASMGMVAEAAQKMAEAIGASLAASIAGGKGAKKSMRDTTEAVLEGLAAQALTHAIFETAMGLADLAVGNPGSAVHFAAAAKFGAVGVAAGLAARAIGRDSSGDTSASSSRAGTSSSGSSSFNSPRSTASNAADANKQSITVNLSVWPGGEAEAGRQVAKALGAYTRESGQSIVDLTTGKAAA